MMGYSGPSWVVKVSLSGKRADLKTLDLSGMRPVIWMFASSGKGNGGKVRRLCFGSEMLARSFSICLNDLLITYFKWL